MILALGMAIIIMTMHFYSSICFVPVAVGETSVFCVAPTTALKSLAATEVVADLGSASSVVVPNEMRIVDNLQYKVE